MKRAVLIGAVAALCVAGSAVAQDRSGGLIGSGTRTDDSGQVLGSGNAAGQMVGSGGFTASPQDSSQVMGSGGRSDSGQVVGSGGLTTSPQDSGQILGSGSRQDAGPGYLGGGGLAVRELRLADGSGLLVVSSDQGTFVIPIAE